MQRICLLIGLSLSILGCNQEQENIGDQQTSAPLNIQLKTVSNDTITITRDSILMIDFPLRSLAEQIKTNGWSMNNMKSKYPFDRDTLVRQGDVNYYTYNQDELLSYYEHISFLKHFESQVPYSSYEFLEELEKTELLYGITWGGQHETEACMVEVFKCSSTHKAQTLAQLYEKRRPLLFIKTLSYAYPIEDRLYLFHARYMGASWYLKKDYEWFSEQF